MLLEIFERLIFSDIQAFLDNINWDFIFVDCISVNHYWRAFRNVIDYFINTFVPLCSTRQQNFNWSPAMGALHREQQRLVVIPSPPGVRPPRGALLNFVLSGSNVKYSHVLLRLITFFA